MVLGVQYTALGKDVMPGLHQTPALTFMSVLVWDVDLPIVLTCRGMIGDCTCKAGTESIVIITSVTWTPLPLRLIYVAGPAT